MGLARKLEPADLSQLYVPPEVHDASASEPRDAVDLSIADPADSPILDDQAVLDILESDLYSSLADPVIDILVYIAAGMLIWTFLDQIGLVTR